MTAPSSQGNQNAFKHVRHGWKTPGELVVSKSCDVMHHPFSVSKVLVWKQRACKKLSAGLLVVTR